MKAGIAERIKAAIGMQRLSKYTLTATDMHTTGELLEAISSMPSMLRLCSKDEQEKLLMSQKSTVGKWRSELAASNTDRHHYQGTTDEDLELPVVIW
jgi:hypothetical protein